MKRYFLIFLGFFKILNFLFIIKWMNTIKLLSGTMPVCSLFHCHGIQNFSHYLFTHWNCGNCGIGPSSTHLSRMNKFVRNLLSARSESFKKNFLWLQECFALSIHEYWEGWRLDDCWEISISVSTLWSSSSSCKTLRCFGAHYPAAAYFSIPPLSVLFYFVLWSAFHVPQNRNLL